MYLCAAALFAVFGISYQNAFASPQNDFYITQALDRYFNLPQDAESLSMAGTSGYFCSSSRCIFLNPAGLGRLQHIELSLQLGLYKLEGEDLFEDSVEQSSDNGFAALAIPLGKIVDERASYGTVAIGYSRYSGETDDRINTTPDGHLRSIAWGYSFSKKVSAGYSLTFYDDQLHSDLADLHSHARFLHVWGTQIKLEDNWEISSTIRLGIGQSDTEDFRFQSNGLSYPREYGGALAVMKTIDTARIALSLDYSHLRSRAHISGVATPVPIGGTEEGDVLNLSIGAEKVFYNSIAVRTGLRWYQVIDYEFKRRDLEDLSGRAEGIGPSVGIGYTYRKDESATPMFSLDYGFQYLSIGSGVWQQLITLTLPLS